MRTGLHSNFPDIREKYREICKSRAFGDPHQGRSLDTLALFGGFPREGNREFSDRKQGKQYRKQGTTVASRQGRTRFAQLETGGGSGTQNQHSLREFRALCKGSFGAWSPTSSITDAVSSDCDPWPGWPAAGQLIVAYDRLSVENYYLTSRLHLAALKGAHLEFAGKTKCRWSDLAEASLVRSRIGFSVFHRRRICRLGMVSGVFHRSSAEWHGRRNQRQLGGELWCPKRKRTSVGQIRVFRKAGMPFCF